MDKLEFDSIHKFLVSLGIVLIALPFVVLYALMNSDIPLVSDAQMKEMSFFSFYYLNQQQKWTFIFYDVFPYISGFSIFFGICLLIYGIRKWYVLQSYKDEQTKMEYMRALDVFRKVDEESAEEDSVTADCQPSIQTVVVSSANSSAVTLPPKSQVSNDNNLIEMDSVNSTKSEEETKSYNVKPIPSETICKSVLFNRNNPESTNERYARILKYVMVEDGYVNKFVLPKYDASYVIERNVKIGSSEYDCIAVSKKEDQDVIYEIKYWPNVGYFGLILLFERTIDRVKNLGDVYECKRHRKWTAILVIVTARSIIEKNKTKVEKYINDRNIDCSSLSIVFCAEEDLQNDI